ncbi:carbamoyl-phosphate synthase small chain, CPSase domain protein [Mycobacterium xenopi 4042]|uniref:Carbamoyl-phosphate synthase small chain, CPSase domain protein n=1 Tax=Mycobacterium xenopi 4042 TaxID=1299334 RepID=X7ZN31_MYCXE|nr:carbamoyl-phosphate synthase small chain, CPSase domain protein [Mycobacterium xenopi 4042]
MNPATLRAVLVLEDGRIFTGKPFGAIGQTLGEAVFSTGMSGYQETLTDPAITARSWWPPRRRSATPGGTPKTPKAAVIGSGWPATRCGIRHRGCRTGGHDHAGGRTGPPAHRRRGRHRHPRRGASHPQLRVDESRNLLRRRPGRAGRVDRAGARPAPMLGADLAARSAPPIPMSSNPRAASVYRRRTRSRHQNQHAAELRRRGIRSHVLPSSATFEQIAEIKPHGVFLSNGPAIRPRPTTSSPSPGRCWTPESPCSASVSATRSWAAHWVCPPTRWCSATAVSTCR